jgi:hypothetical protein
MKERGGDGGVGGHPSGAAVVSLMLLRGEVEMVQHDDTERTVAFQAFSTFRSRQRCPLGGKGYYELTIIVNDGQCPQYGFVSAAFQHVQGISKKGVGDDDVSWAVDGDRKLKFHKGKTTKYRCEWKKDYVVGLACDLQAMKMLVSVNGSFDAPNGHVFDLAPDAVRDGLFAAFSGQQGMLHYNMGETPFQHAPPSPEYLAFSQFEADTRAKD